MSVLESLSNKVGNKNLNGKTLGLKGHYNSISSIAAESFTIFTLNKFSCDVVSG